jgi:hypothetical protein
MNDRLTFAGNKSLGHSLFCNHRVFVGLRDLAFSLRGVGRWRRYCNNEKRQAKEGK